MNYKNEAVNRILNELEKSNYKHSVYYDDKRYKIVIETNKKGEELFVRFKDSNLVRIIRMHRLIHLDKKLATEKKDRLLVACNIINREDYVKAILFDDCIDIVYEIPERSFNIAEKIVIDTIYFFYTRVDIELFNKAIISDEDLCDYSK